MLHIVSLLFVLISGACCTEPDTPKPNPCIGCPSETPKLKTVWITPLPYNDNRVNFQPILFDSLVVFGIASIDEQQHAFGFSKVTGAQKWHWTGAESSTSFGSIGIINEYGIISYRNRDHVFNLYTGVEKWEYKTNAGIAGNPRANTIGSMIYHPWEIADFSNDSLAWLMRSGISSPQWEALYTIKRDSSELQVSIEPPSLWMSESGDSILVSVGRNLDKNLADQTNFYAFNLKTKKMQWSIKKICSEGLAAVHPILISKNIAYLFGAYFVYAIDLNTGKLKWKSAGQNPTINNLLNANCIIVGNVLYVKTTTSLMYAMNISDGKIIWSNNDGNLVSGSNLVYYKNKIYYIGYDRLYVINPSTGAVVAKYKTPSEYEANSKGYFNGYGGVVIDAATDLMYFADSHHVMCVEVPE